MRRHDYVNGGYAHRACEPPDYYVKQRRWWVQAEDFLPGQATGAKPDNLGELLHFQTLEAIAGLPTLATSCDIHDMAYHRFNGSGSVFTGATKFATSRHRLRKR